MVRGIGLDADEKLPLVAETLHQARLGDRELERREEQRDQKRDDGDHDQQFNERKREALTLMNSQAVPALSSPEGQRATEGPRSAAMRRPATLPKGTCRSDFVVHVVLEKF